MKIFKALALLTAFSLPLSSAVALDLQSGPAEAQTPKKDSKKKTTKKKTTAKPKTASKKKTTTKPKVTTKSKTESKKTTKSKTATKPKTTTAPAKKTAKPTKKKTPTAKASPNHLTPASPAFMKKAATMVKGIPAGQRSKFLKLLNSGSPTDLSEVKGIGPVKAANIKKARPLKKVEDLANVTGFGEKTFKEVVNSVKKMK